MVWGEPEGLVPSETFRGRARCIKTYATKH